MFVECAVMSLGAARWLGRARLSHPGYLRALYVSYLGLTHNHIRRTMKQSVTVSHISLISAGIRYRVIQSN